MYLEYTCVGNGVKFHFLLYLIDVDGCNNSQRDDAKAINASNERVVKREASES